MRNKIFMCTSVWLLIIVDISCQNASNGIKTNGNPIAFFVPDTLVTSKLPFGYKQLCNPKLNMDEIDYPNSKLNSYYDSIGAKINNISNFKFPQKNIYDFDLRYIQKKDSISTNLDVYNISKRLPNINGYRVYIANSTKNKKYYFLDGNIDLILIDKNNLIINSLNISHYEYEDSMKEGSENKYFYIDENYIIHIKYFNIRLESKPTLLGYIKYKILKNGSITRYFDNDGYYKSLFEKGNVKNHTKDGIWHEYIGGGEIGEKDRITVSEVNYKNGIVDGNIKIYSPDTDSGEKTLQFSLKLNGDKYDKVD